MKLTIFFEDFKRGWMVFFSTAAAFTFLLSAGCSKEEKEKEPVVTVQTTPVKRDTISQVITAEAVVYPLEQATVSPKITAPITEFKVRRGTPVKKGQLLAILENKDLAAQAEASKGSFEQADAGYKTSMEAAKSFFSKARFPSVTWMQLPLPWRKPAALTKWRRSSLRT
jgi:multidrug efflux pump subunit AcrA (membrane-fusion protein)